MRGTFLLTTFLVFLSLFYVPILEAQQGSPREALDRFCTLDTQGKQLKSEAQEELAPLLADKQTWDQHPEITVVKDYSVRQLSVQRDSAEFAVDYNVLGRLDPSLRFTRLQHPYTNRPIVLSEIISLVRSDVHYEIGSYGVWLQVKGSAAWRIKTAPSSPHVSIAAALGYVGAVSHRSKDPLLATNAQRAMSELQNLYRLQALPPQFVQSIEQSPVAILSQFISLEADGAGLTANGLGQLGVYFVHPAQRSGTRVHVVTDYAVKNANVVGSTANLYVEYASVGDLDPSLHFVSAAPGGNNIREDYKLVLNDKYVLPTRGTVPAKVLIGPSRWQIEDAHPEQWITVNAAIRYVTEIHQTAKDPIIKENADKTLAALAHYHE